MLVQEARSDCQAAQDLLARNRPGDGLAHLARACEFNPESGLAGEIAVSAEDSDQTFPPLFALQGHAGSVSEAEFSPDGTRIVTASKDRTARVWDAAGGKLLFTLQGHNNWVKSAKFSPDGTRIVTASNDNTARVWDAGSGKLLLTLRGHTDWVWSGEFSADGTRIVTASKDHTARVWDAGSGKLLFTLEGHTDYVNCAEFSPDGTRIVTASNDNTARIWDAAGGKLLSTLQGHTSWVESAEFSPDGTRVVTAGDKTGRVWDAASGKLLFTLQGHNDWVKSAKFSPDGTRIVTASRDHTARVWNAGSGKLIFTLEGHTNGIFSAEFSPDGTRIVTASNDHTARVWDAGSGKLISALRGHTNWVKSAMFSPEGTRIVTASTDDTARVWEFPVFTEGPPNWFAPFLRWLGQREFNSAGDLVDISASEWQTLKEQITQPAFADHSRYGQVAQWFLLCADQRPIRPGSPITQKQVADELITAEADISEIRRAHALDPAHPLVQLALARFDRDPQRSAFLRQYSLKRLPQTADYLRRAAELLATQNQSAAALDYVNRALRLSPGDSVAVRLRETLSSAKP